MPEPGEAPHPDPDGAAHPRARPPAWSVVLWLITAGCLAGSLVALRQQAGVAAQATLRADQAEAALGAARRANRLLRQRFDESRSGVSLP